MSLACRQRGCMGPPRGAARAAAPRLQCAFASAHHLTLLLHTGSACVDRAGCALGPVKFCNTPLHMCHCRTWRPGALETSSSRRRRPGSAMCLRSGGQVGRTKMIIPHKGCSLRHSTLTVISGTQQAHCGAQWVFDTGWCDVPLQGSTSRTWTRWRCLSRNSTS